MTNSAQIASRGAAPKQRLLAVQGLRGLAAGLVVCAHAIQHGPGRAPDPIVLLGRFGVEIFFVISGIVIAYVAGNASFDGGRFIVRRIWRVVPLYWATTLVVAVAAIVVPSVFKTTEFGLEYLIKSLFFIPAPLPGTSDWRPLFKLGWTLNYEVFFYVVMAALFWCTSMVRRAQLLTIVMGTLIALSFVVPDRSLIGFYADLNLIAFVVGVWFAVLWQKQLLQRTPSWTPAVLAALAALACFRFFSLPVDVAKTTMSGHLMMATAAALIVLTALSLESRIKAGRVVVWLGDISYSLYLTHMFVVGAGWAAINRLHLTGPVLGIAIASLVLLALVVAHLSFILLERPMMRHQPFSKRATVPAHGNAGVAGSVTDGS